MATGRKEAGALPIALVSYGEGLKYWQREATADAIAAVANTSRGIVGKAWAGIE